MSFDYEQSIWGRGEASGRWSDPAAFRLRQALRVVDEAGKAGEARNAKEAGKVLEVGCGAGQFIRAIKKLRPELDCFGADISREAIAIAKNRNDGVSYSLSEAESLPYPDNFFDAVLIFDVLEHVENPAQILREVRRVLKPGGIFYAFVPCEGDATSLWHLLDRLHLKNDLTKKYAGHIQYFSRAHFFKLLSDSGFTIQRARYSEHFFGQLLGIVAFHLMDRAARKNKLTQLNNESFFTDGSSKNWRWLKSLINSIIFLESVCFSRLPSPNIHIVCKK